MRYWLIKTDPKTYSWDNLIKDKKTIWDGVRNYQARNYLAEMKKNDNILVYHSSEGAKEIVGIAVVTKEAFQDPTTDDVRWLAVEIKALEPLKTRISLDEIKKDAKLKDIMLLKQSRLSVMPITEEHFNLITGTTKI